MTALELVGAQPQREGLYTRTGDLGTLPVTANSVDSWYIACVFLVGAAPYATLTAKTPALPGLTLGSRAQPESSYTNRELRMCQRVQLNRI